MRKIHKFISEVQSKSWAEVQGQIEAWQKFHHNFVERYGEATIGRWGVRCKNDKTPSYEISSELKSLSSTLGANISTLSAEDFLSRLLSVHSPHLNVSLFEAIYLHHKSQSLEYAGSYRHVRDNSYDAYTVAYRHQDYDYLKALMGRGVRIYSNQTEMDVVTKAIRENNLRAFDIVWDNNLEVAHIQTLMQHNSVDIFESLLGRSNLVKLIEQNTYVAKYLAGHENQSIYNTIIEQGIYLGEHSMAGFSQLMHQKLNSDKSEEFGYVLDYFDLSDGQVVGEILKIISGQIKYDGSKAGPRTKLLAGLAQRFSQSHIEYNGHCYNMAEFFADDKFIADNIEFFGQIKLSGHQSVIKARNGFSSGAPKAFGLSETQTMMIEKYQLESELKNCSKSVVTFKL